MGPGSSGGTEEQRVLNAQVGGSTPPSGFYLYGVVRKDFTAATFVVQYGHALTECLRPEDLPLPADTRSVLLGATKEQMTQLVGQLISKGVHHCVIVETGGPLAGVVTAIGLLTRDRDALKAAVPLLDELKKWKEPKQNLDGAPARGAATAPSGGQGSGG